MLTVEEMIKIIRSTVHDVQELEYTNEHIIGVINSGVRFIRRQIKNIRPQMLIEPPITGTITAGTSFIDLPSVPTKVVDVYIAGQRINSINFLTLDNPSYGDGHITSYYLTGDKTMNFYPVPLKDTDYMVRVVGSANKLINLTDTSPFADEMDDFLIEYACIRLSFANEFDMSQETQLLSVLTDQINTNILNIEEPATVVDSYFARGYW